MRGGYKKNSKRNLRKNVSSKYYVWGCGRERLASFPWVFSNLKGEAFCFSNRMPRLFLLNVVLLCLHCKLLTYYFTLLARSIFTYNNIKYYAVMKVNKQIV